MPACDLFRFLPRWLPADPQVSRPCRMHCEFQGNVHYVNEGCQGSERDEMGSEPGMSHASPCPALRSRGGRSGNSAAQASSAHFVDEDAMIQRGMQWAMQSLFGPGINGCHMSLSLFHTPRLALEPAARASWWCAARTGAARTRTAGRGRLGCCCSRVPGTMPRCSECAGLATATTRTGTGASQM